jgi:hypothetical protein
MGKVVVPICRIDEIAKRYGFDLSNDDYRRTYCPRPIKV